MVRKLKASGFPKFEIITITGHRQEQSVEAYDSGNEEVRKTIRDNPKIFLKSKKMFNKSKKNISNRHFFFFKSLLNSLSNLKNYYKILTKLLEP